MNKRKTGDTNTGQKHIKAHGPRSYTRVEKTANAGGGKKYAEPYIYLCGVIEQKQSKR